MSTSNVFSISSLIRLMLVGALVAILVVIVQSCQSPKSGLDTFSKGSLKRLEVLENPPTQPTMIFAGPGGQEMTLADYRGKVVLLNVWATWCAPCVIEMPMLNELQAQRGGDGFQVVTVSIDRQAADAEQFFDDKSITHLTPWHDNTYGLAPKVGAPGLPVSIFYSRSGRELARVAGEVDWTSKEARALVDHLME